MKGKRQRGCQAKVDYFSREEAEEALERMARLFGDRSLQVYSCRWAPHWHIGHRFKSHKRRALRQQLGRAR